MRRRQRVVLRPKVRSQRLQQRAALAAILALGAGAFFSLRHAAQALPSWAGVKGRLSPGIESVSVDGAPEALTAELAAFLKDAPGAPAQRAEALRQKWPCLKSVAATRDWLNKSARFTVELHAGVARAELKGRPAGFLSDTGEVFAADAAFYPEARVVVEAGSADRAQLERLAGTLRAVGRSRSLPSPLAVMRFVSAQDGWEARLDDGTTVLWGELSWTEEKLVRLREVLADARERFAGTLTADLRYFEDGKVLLTPLSDKPAGLR